MCDKRPRPEDFGLELNAYGEGYWISSEGEEAYYAAMEKWKDKQSGSMAGTQEKDLFELI